MKKLFIVILLFFITLLLLAALSSCSGPAFIDIVRKISNATSMEIEMKVEYEQSSRIDEVMSMRVIAEQKEKEEFAYVETISQGNKSEVYVKNDLVYTYLNGDMIGIVNGNNYDDGGDDKLTNVMVLNFVGIDYELQSEKRPKGKTAYIITIDKKQIGEVFGSPPGWLRYDSCVATLIAKNSKNMPETMQIVLELSNGSKINYNINYKSINAKINKGLPNGAEAIVPEEYGLEYQFTSGLQSYEVKKYNGVYDKVVIPSTYEGLPVVSIGSYAFDEAYSVKTIYLPDTIVELKPYAISLPVNNSVDKIYLSKNLTKIGSFAFSNYAGEIVIPEDIALNKIDEEAFAEYLGNTLNLPFMYTEIGYRAFYMSNIEEFNLSDTLTVIGERAFSYCNNITSIVIPESVVSIGDYAFSSCDNLEQIDILGNSIVHLGSGFIQCSPVKRINSEVDGVFNLNDSITTIGNSAFAGIQLLVHLKLPNSLISIPHGLCDSCYNLESVSMPSQLQVIGYTAFLGCKILRSVNIPAGVTVIESFAFAYCNALESVIFEGDGITNIPEGIFSGCRNLSDIIIPNSVIIISTEAFIDCNSLNHISVRADNQHYKDIDGVLYNKEGTAIIKYPSAKEAKVYVVEERVEEVAEYAFYGAINLEQIELPESLLSIGLFAFCEMSNFVTLIVHAPQPPISPYDIFAYNSQAKTYVPAEYLETYLLVYPWLYKTYSLEELSSD